MQCKNLRINRETAMVAVLGLDIEKIESLLLEVDCDKDEICEIANDSFPGQIILSGTKKQLK